MFASVRNFALLSASAIFLSSCGAPVDPAEQRNHQILLEAKAGIRAMLRDPESAQFGPMQINSRGVVCGFVNARNGFGGYTGQQAFYWLPDRRDGLIATGEDGIATITDAEMFEAKGCSIGGEHERALEAGRLMRAPITMNQSQP